MKQPQTEIEQNVDPELRIELGVIDAKVASTLQASAVMLVLVTLPFFARTMERAAVVQPVLMGVLLAATAVLLCATVFRSDPSPILLLQRKAALNFSIILILITCGILAILLLGTVG